MEEQYEELLRLIRLKHKLGAELNEINYQDNLGYDTPGYVESREAGERRGELNQLLIDLRPQIEAIAPNAWHQSRDFEQILKKAV